MKLACSSFSFFQSFISNLLAFYYICFFLPWALFHKSWHTSSYVKINFWQVREVPQPITLPPCVSAYAFQKTILFHLNSLAKIGKHRIHIHTDMGKRTPEVEKGASNGAAGKMQLLFISILSCRKVYYSSMKCSTGKQLWMVCFCH